MKPKAGSVASSAPLRARIPKPMPESSRANPTTIPKTSSPWPTILIYAIAIPAVVYLVIANAFHLGADGRGASSRD